jgi:hypothetical protein
MPKAFGPEHWRSRAEQLRMLAELLHNLTERRELAQLAAMCEQIAQDGRCREPSPVGD